MLMFLNKSQTPAKTPKPTKKIFFVDFPQKFSGKFVEEMFNFYGIPNFFEREFKLLKEKMNYRNYQFLQLSNKNYQFFQSSKIFVNICSNYYVAISVIKR